MGQTLAGLRLLAFGPIGVAVGADFWAAPAAHQAAKATLFRLPMASHASSLGGLTATPLAARRFVMTR